MKLLLKTALLAGALGFAGQAQAAVVAVNQTLDLTQPKAAPGPGFQGWNDTPAFNGGYSVSIAAGDTFDYTVDFLGSQTLTVDNLSAVWAFSFSGSPSSQVTGTGIFSFLDALGNAFLTSNILTDTEGDAHFGQYFTSSEFAGGLPASLTFSGVRYTGTLDSYDTPGAEARLYNQPAFYFVADSTDVGGAVPEPASWALMIAGFGLIGGAMRRANGQRRTKLAVSYA